MADMIDEGLREYKVPEGTKRLRHAGPGEERCWGLVIDHESVTLTTGREDFSNA